MGLTKRCLLGIVAVTPLIALAWASDTAAGGQESPGPGSQTVQLRKEFFALRTPGSTPEADPVALVAWKQSDRPGGPVLECELLFGEGELRVLHTENHSLANPRLVWRELGTAGRTWLAEWSPSEGTLESMEFSAAQDVHGEALTGDVEFPLGVVERLRRESVGPESFQWVSPTRAGVVQARLVEHSGSPWDLPGWAELAEGEAGGEAIATHAQVPGLRRVELVAESGDQLACYLLRGSALVGFQWGAGSPWALPIREADWESAAAAWRAAKARREIEAAEE